MRLMVAACTMFLLAMAGCTKQPASPPAPSYLAEPKAGDTMTVDIGAGVNMNFCWCPPGSFTMGSPDGEADREKMEGPQHTVTFKQGFWIGKYEVTQGQWKSVMGDNPSYFNGNDKLPVETVTWDDCQKFLRKLNAKGGGTFRLPSEAEWEYACRAGTQTPFFFGEILSKVQANCNDDSDSNGGQNVKPRITTEVGSYPANTWNLFDMHGNVEEWCQDTLHKDYADAPTDGSAWESPTASCWLFEAPPTSYRMLRGGSFDIFAHYSRSANRCCAPPYNSLSDLGFRVVWTP